MHMEKIPFLSEKYNLSAEPAGNFQSVELYRTESGGDHSIVKFEKRRSSGGSVEENDGEKPRSLGNTLRRMVSVGAGGGRSEGGVYSPFHFLMDNEKPSDEHGLYDTELNGVRANGRNHSSVHSVFCFNNLNFLTAVPRSPLLLHVAAFVLLQ